MVLRIDNWARHARHQTRRPHAGVKIENDPQLHLRCDLGAIGIADIRQTACAQQDGVSVLA